MARAIPSVRNPNVINLHVSTNYVKSWGKWHAIREFYQNLYDACLTLVNNNVNNLYVDHQPDNLFVFADKSKNLKALAFMQYEAATQTLVMSNELGEKNLTTRCLILGGSDANKHAQAPEAPQAGQFGEGFKLACLSLLRGGCEVNVLVRNNTWRFSLKPDPLFENEVCLHVEILKDTQQSTVIEITIKGITQEDFTTARRRLLYLTDIDPQRQYETPEGVVLFAPEYASKIFVKGIYVSEKPCGWHQDVGYDTYNLKLDRDRMAFQDPSVFLHQTSKIFAQTLDYYVSTPNLAIQAQLLVARVYTHINSAQLSCLYAYLTKQEAINLFWSKFQEYHPAKQPTSAYMGAEYILATKFLNIYVVVDHHLQHVLRKSNLFRTPHQWLAEFTNTRPEHQFLPGDVNELNRAKAWVVAMPVLNILDIKVLENHATATHNDIICVKNKCLYVPKAQVDKEREVLRVVDGVDVSLGRALQVISVRCKNSDSCIQL